MKIHPTAAISPDAKIGSNVEIGAFSVIEDHVEIGDNCYIDAHVKVARYTKVGQGCRFYYGALIGEEPQDHRFKKGIVSYTEIGAETVLREYVTIHRPPFPEQKTVVGSNTLLMAFVHVGHDACIGNHVTVANHTAISGHVHIEDGAVLSGYVLIHQFCRIGSLAMIGGRTIITQDIPPYCMLAENNCICGPNTIGLRRAGLAPERRAAVRRAIKIYFFRGLNSKNAFLEIAKAEMTPEVLQFVTFIQQTSRGIMNGDPDMAFMKDNMEITEEDSN
jgi:UDP-N-acetylglucosamine acyltransferase